VGGSDDRRVVWSRDGLTLMFAKSIMDSSLRKCRNDYTSILPKREQCIDEHAIPGFADSLVAFILFLVILASLLLAASRSTHGRVV